MGDESFESLSGGGHILVAEVAGSVITRRLHVIYFTECDFDANCTCFFRHYLIRVLFILVDTVLDMTPTHLLSRNSGNLLRCQRYELYRSVNFFNRNNRANTEHRALAVYATRTQYAMSTAGGVSPIIKYSR